MIYLITAYDLLNNCVILYDLLNNWMMPYDLLNNWMPYNLLNNWMMPYDLLNNWIMLDDIMVKCSECTGQFTNAHSFLNRTKEVLKYICLIIKILKTTKKPSNNRTRIRRD